MTPLSQALEAIAVAVGDSAFSPGFQLVDAATLAEAFERHPFDAGLIGLSPFRPVLVTNITSPALVTNILNRIYEAAHAVVVIERASGADSVVRRCALRDLDTADLTEPIALWIEPLPEIAASGSFAGLTRIVARLRAPGGCPWDQKQNEQSLLDSLLEEAYEAVEAIESGDAAHAAEELGDLMMLIAMEAQVATEAGDFTIEDVIEGISAKLIRRHPHVFGELSANSPDEVVGIWQKVKATEGKRPKPAHPLDRYPAPMPIARRLIDHLSIDNPTTSIDPEEVGEQLYRLTCAAIEAGYNPEQLLLQAAKRDIPENSAS